jgi:hypothetical protein
MEYCEVCGESKLEQKGFHREGGGDSWCGEAAHYLRRTARCRKGSKARGEAAVVAAVKVAKALWAKGVWEKVRGFRGS